MKKEEQKLQKTIGFYNCTHNAKSEIHSITHTAHCEPQGAPFTEGQTN